MKKLGEVYDNKKTIMVLSNASCIGCVLNQNGIKCETCTSENGNTIAVSLDTYREKEVGGFNLFDIASEYKEMFTNEEDNKKYFSLGLDYFNSYVNSLIEDRKKLLENILESLKPFEEDKTLDLKKHTDVTVKVIEELNNLKNVLNTRVVSINSLNNLLKK